MQKWGGGVDSRYGPLDDEWCMGLGPYLLNRYSRIPGTQPQEHEYRISPAEPFIRQERVHIQGDCIHKTG